MQKLWRRSSQTQTLRVSKTLRVTTQPTLPQVAFIGLGL
jgi:hypothetical protein